MDVACRIHICIIINATSRHVIDVNLRITIYIVNDYLTIIYICKMTVVCRLLSVDYSNELLTNLLVSSSVEEAVEF